MDAARQRGRCIHAGAGVAEGNQRVAMYIVTSKP